MIEEGIGTIVSLQISVTHRVASKKIEEAKFIEGYGIEGDRHASARIERQGYQVLIMDQETLNEFELGPGIIKEQITTSGIDVGAMQPGQQLSIGDEVVIKISQDAVPCSRLDEILAGLQNKLVGRRGKLASIVIGGTVRVGDPAQLI